MVRFALAPIVVAVAFASAWTAPVRAGAAHTAAVLSPDAVGHRIALERPGEASLSLYYEEQGKGAPLLLLHGLGESTFTWHEIAPRLAARHRVIALDLKGFGRSDKPEDGAYTADDQAALVARFLMAKGLENVTVVGHSFGGTVALRTALADGIRGTNRIRRVAVIGAPALPQSTPYRFDLVRAPAIPDLVIAAMPPEALARLLLREAMGGRKVSEETVEGYAAPYRDAAAARAFVATARAIVEEEDAKAVAERYRKLKLPVLLVWCRKDPIVPLKAGRRLAETLPRARLSIIERCHHLPQHERPDELLRVLGTFLGK